MTSGGSQKAKIVNTSNVIRSAPTRKRAPTISAKTRRYEAQNREAAEIILADRDRYDGLPVLWAEAFLARDREQPGPGSLFAIERGVVLTGNELPTAGRAVLRHRAAQVGGVRW